jgi:lipoate-protein ligase A
MSHVIYPKSTWRLLLETHPCQGAVNLAIDETLVRHVANGQSLPTLRLYQWKSPALVLGRGQRASDADTETLQRDDVILLRRMTGGTAVLNDDVISYSIAVPGDETRFSGTIAESYRGVSLALAAGVHLLGAKDVAVKAMDPELAAQNRVKRSPVCFEIPSFYEITVDDRKLIGSSQMRIKGGILQHGSLYLDSDIGKICHYLSAHPNPERIRSKTLNLQQVLETCTSYYEVTQAFVAGFREVLNLQFFEGALQPSERSMVNQLVEEKYDNQDFIYRL